jgi:hypothetical protein
LLNIIGAEYKKHEGGKFKLELQVKHMYVGGPKRNLLIDGPVLQHRLLQLKK